MPEQHIPTDEELLSLVRARPLITLLEICLCLWCLPWQAPDPHDSLTTTPRRWPGEPRPLCAARWLYRRLARLADRSLLVLNKTSCCSKAGCLRCLASLTAEVLPSLDSLQGPSSAASPLSIDQGAAPAAPAPGAEQVITGTVQIEGGPRLVLQLCGTVGRVLRQTRRGLRSCGGAHLRADDTGLELVAPGLSDLEIAALEDYLQSGERPRLPPEIELLVAALPELEQAPADAAVHLLPRCPDCLSLHGRHGKLCPARPQPANDQSLPAWLGPIDEARLDAALDRGEVGHA